MKTYQVAVLALVAVLGWSAFVSDSQIVDGVRSSSRKLLAVDAAGGGTSLITYTYPPPPPSKEYVAAVARQQRLRDLLYGSLTPPGMQATVTPDLLDAMAGGEDSSTVDPTNGAGEGLSTADPTNGPAAAPEESPEAKASDDDDETVQDGGPFLVLGVSFILITGIGGAVFALYKMRDSPWLNDVLRRGVKKADGTASAADSHSASRSEVLKAKMAKLRESINNSA